MVKTGKGDIGNDQRKLLIFEGLVYDVSDFEHPGGAELISEYQGQDVSDLLQSVTGPHQHSQAALDILKALPVVGRINGLCSNSTAGNSFAALAFTEETVSDSGKHHSAKLDLNRPLFEQLWKMRITVKEYVDMIHRPYHLPAGRSVLLFRNPTMESLTRTRWWMIPIVWLPVSIALLLGISREFISKSPLLSAVIFPVSALLWTFVEYSLHRFIFHVDHRLPESKLAIIAHFAFHGVHHLVPMDRLRLVFPPAAAAIIVSIIWLILSTLLSQPLVSLVIAGGLVGYVVYDLMHYYLHHGGHVWWRVMRARKTAHMQHHYQDYNMNFGITTNVWDNAFRTAIKL